MITDKRKVVKCSFYVPVDYLNNIYADGVRQAIIDLFGAFNIYYLETKETTLEEENVRQTMGN